MVGRAKRRTVSGADNLGSESCLVFLGVPMDDFLADLRHEFRRHKGLADRAMGQLDDRELFERPGAVVNPVVTPVVRTATQAGSSGSAASR